MCQNGVLGPLQLLNYKTMLVKGTSLFMTLTQLHLIDSIKGKTKEKLEEFGILIFTLVSEMEDKTVLDILGVYSR